MVSVDFRKQALGYGLTTAHILYRRPDHRWLLQSNIWQNYDLFPEFPELHRFLQADQAGGAQDDRRGIPAALAECGTRGVEPRLSGQECPLYPHE